MRDEDQIAALIFAYAERMDRGDFAAVGALFERAVYRAEGGPPFEGAAAVERILRELVVLYDDGTPRTKHLVTNLAVEVDGGSGTASASSCFAVLQAVEGLPLQPIVVGRYRDRFEWVPPRWCFRERRIFVDLLGDVSRHLRAFPGRA